MKVTHLGLVLVLSFIHDNKSAPTETSAILSYNGKPYRKATVKKYYKDKSDAKQAEHFAFTKLLTLCGMDLSKKLYAAWAHS
jgi:hypothetical protein